MPDLFRLLKPKGASGSFKEDFLASIVVFLVALPLCLGIAIASGAPPLVGLVSGIIGGLVVGALGGAPLQVSGPAAGLVALVYETIQKFGLEGLGIVVLLAGLMQVGAGWLRLGGWFRAVSPAVIQGMLAGIGVLIIASQLHVMLDVKPESSGLENILTIPQSIMKGLAPTDDSKHHLAAMVGLMTIVAVLIWNTMPRKVKMVPAALVAVILGVVVSNTMGLPINYVDVPGQIVEALTFPNADSLGLLADSAIWVAALTIAIVASAETMLSASAVDQLHTGPRTRYDKELFAQGVANSLAGLVGALPITGVIVRSSANVQAGAKTRMSAFLHAVWILGLIALFPTLLETIPTASLAAILVYTGYKLVQPASFKRFWALGKAEFAIFVVTMTMVVATNLLEGVIAGTVLALIKLLVEFSRLEGQSVSSEDGERIDLMLNGSATFLSLPKLVGILECQPLGKQLYVHIEALSHLDHACLDLLKDWERQYNASGGRFHVEWHGCSIEPGQKPSPQELASLPGTAS